MGLEHTDGTRTLASKHNTIRELQGNIGLATRRRDVAALQEMRYNERKIITTIILISVMTKTLRA